MKLQITVNVNTSNLVFKKNIFLLAISRGQSSILAIFDQK